MKPMLTLNTLKTNGSTLVHNGVIENYADLKKEYLSDVKFVSQTDTEVIVQLVDKFVVESGMSTEAALLKVLLFNQP